MQFKARKSFGPAIRMTDAQEKKVLAILDAAGLNGCVENCWTGSAYVTIYDANDDQIAKIRLSGHDEGKRQDSTHCVIGSKSACLTALWPWIDSVIADSKAVSAV